MMVFYLNSALQASVGFAVFFTPALRTMPWFGLAMLMMSCENLCFDPGCWIQVEYVTLALRAIAAAEAIWLVIDRRHHIAFTVGLGLFASYCVSTRRMQDLINPAFRRVRCCLLAGCAVSVATAAWLGRRTTRRIPRLIVGHVWLLAAYLTESVVMALIIYRGHEFDWMRAGHQIFTALMAGLWLRLLVTADRRDLAGLAAVGD